MAKRTTKAAGKAATTKKSSKVPAERRAQALLDWMLSEWPEEGSGCSMVRRAKGILRAAVSRGATVDELWAGLKRTPVGRNLREAFCDRFDVDSVDVAIELEYCEEAVVALVTEHEGNLSEGFLKAAKAERQRLAAKAEATRQGGDLVGMRKVDDRFGGTFEPVWRGRR